MIMTKRMCASAATTLAVLLLPTVTRARLAGCVLFRIAERFTLALACFAAGQMRALHRNKAILIEIRFVIRQSGVHVGHSSGKGSS